MNLRRSAAGLAAVCLALGFFLVQPGTARSEVAASDTRGSEGLETVAAVNATSPKGGEQAAVSLEQAIRNAREAFVVPDGFDQFSSGFNQSGMNSFWELNWRRGGEPGGDMNVRVNAETGEVWSMHRWLPPAPGQEFRGLPKYTREQLESNARDLAQRLQPERFQETRLQPDRSQHYFIPLQQARGPVDYSYRYARSIDGVPCLDNGITVTVSGDTGEVTGFDLNWDEAKDFPSAAGRISQAQAEQIFRNEAAPELYYFRPRTPGGREVPLKLVYRLPGPQNQVIIDAVTGKVLSKEGEYQFYSMDAAGGGEPRMAKLPMQNIELTPVEESAVKEARNLLSRDRALETTRSAVKVPADFTLDSSRLVQDYLFRDNKTWQFHWQGGDEANRKWMDVSVDAITGELISFYRSQNDYQQPPEVKFSEEAARKAAEDFLKKAQIEKWRQVVFKAARPMPGPVPLDAAGKLQPRQYSFNWARVVNDIQFPENGFSLDVDSATGEVVRYQMNWWNVDFPSPQGVITREAAADKYLREAPLTAAYLRIWPQYPWPGPREAKIHLVYQLSRQDFTMLDAFTGQPLNYEGNVATSPGEKARFDDLGDNPSRAAVETLARFGIVSGEDGKFRPDDPITQAELITLLVKSERPEMAIKTLTAAGKDSWYQRYYDQAARMGIIQAGEQPDPEAPVLREVLARLTIHAMGYYQVARLSDIYVLNFQDAAEVPDYLRGHVALAAGLGLIEPVDGKFLPEAVVTRGEAAVTLLKMLNIGK